MMSAKKLRLTERDVMLAETLNGSEVAVLPVNVLEKSDKSADLISMKFTS